MSPALGIEVCSAALEEQPEDPGVVRVSAERDAADTVEELIAQADAIVVGELGDSRTEWVPAAGPQDEGSGSITFAQELAVTEVLGGPVQVGDTLGVGLRRDNADRPILEFDQAVPRGGQAYLFFLRSVAGKSPETIWFAGPEATFEVTPTGRLALTTRCYPVGATFEGASLQEARAMIQDLQ